MKAVKKIFDSMRPAFEEGGKLKSMRAVFEATENFFLFHGEPTIQAPHVRDPLDLKRFMMMAIFAILPATLAGVYFFGLRVLAMIVVSYAAGGAVEVVFAMIRKEEITEGFLVTGLIFPLILPPGLPLWMVGIGVAFGVLVGKELFGGTGRNLFNPALVGRAFLFLGYPVAMSRDYWLKPAEGGIGRTLEYVSAATADATTQATPLSVAKSAGGELVHFSDLLWGNVGGSVGETSGILILAGGLFLIATRIINWRSVLGVLASFAVLGLCMHNFPGYEFPVGWHLLAGGMLFGTFFMVTDPITSPVTNGGKWAYGVLIGSLVVLIRLLTGYVEGVMFAILLGNICAPILDEVSFRLRLRRLQDEG